MFALSSRVLLEPKEVPVVLLVHVNVSVSVSDRSASLEATLHVKVSVVLGAEGVIEILESTGAEF